MAGGLEGDGDEDGEGDCDGDGYGYGDGDGEWDGDGMGTGMEMGMGLGMGMVMAMVVNHHDVHHDVLHGVHHLDTEEVMVEGMVPVRQHLVTKHLGEATDGRHLRGARRPVKDLSRGWIDHLSMVDEALLFWAAVTLDDQRIIWQTERKRQQDSHLAISPSKPGLR